MSNKALIAAGGGAAGALLAGAAFTGVPGGVFLAYFAPLPLVMVGLSHGVGSLGLAAAAGIVVCFAIGGVAGAAVYAALSALPSWLMVDQALKRRLDPTGDTIGWRPIGSIIAKLTLVVSVTMIALGLATAEGEPIEAMVRSQLQTSFAASLPQLDPSVLATLVDKVAPLFLGMSAAIWLLMIAINGILAECFLVTRGWAIRPGPRWSAFALPDWFAWPLVITAVIALIPDGDVQYIARNLVLVMAAGYLFQGLATIHSVSHDVRGRRALLATVYVLLLIFSVVAAPLIAGLGMIDQWAGIRRRIAGSRIEWE